MKERFINTEEALIGIQETKEIKEKKYQERKWWKYYSELMKGMQPQIQDPRISNMMYKLKFTSGNNRVKLQYTKTKLHHSKEEERKEVS